MTPPETNLRRAHVQECFVRHIYELRGFVLALVPAPHLADDIVQETFVTATEKADTYEPGTNFKAWIFTIARYKILNTVRRLRHQPGLLDPAVIELLVQTDPEMSVDDRQVALLDECVGRLPPAKQRAILLRYQEGCQPPEIARRMEWTIGSVNVALTRARKLLHDCVAGRLAAPTP